MDRAHLSLRRASRRRREGGVAMFIVTMMMTVLATVGLYALASATTEIRTAGNERQNTQTHYLADYGIVAIAREVDSVKVGSYLGLMFPATPVACQSLPIPSNPVIAATDSLARACARIEPADMQSIGQWATGATVAYSPPAQQGSLGPVPTTAGFYVELTDPTYTSVPPRYSLDLHLCFIMLTATSTGVTLPQFNSGTSTSAAYGDEGLEIERARIVAGPTPCPH